MPLSEGGRLSKPQCARTHLPKTDKSLALVASAPPRIQHRACGMRRGTSASEAPPKSKEEMTPSAEGQKEFTTKAEYNRWLVARENSHAAESLRMQARQSARRRVTGGLWRGGAASSLDASDVKAYSLVGCPSGPAYAAVVKSTLAPLIGAVAIATNASQTERVKKELNSGGNRLRTEGTLPSLPPSNKAILAAKSITNGQASPPAQPAMLSLQ